jgi:hypothetical protein
MVNRARRYESSVPTEIDYQAGHESGGGVGYLVSHDIVNVAQMLTLRPYACTPEQLRDPQNLRCAARVNIRVARSEVALRPTPRGGAIELVAGPFTPKWRPVSLRCHSHLVSMGILCTRDI